MHIGFNHINFEDFYSLEGLRKIDDLFLSFLQKENLSLANDLLQYRNQHKIAANNSIISLAPYLEDFLVNLFQISDQISDIKEKTAKFQNIYLCKRDFIQRNVSKKFNIANLDQINFLELEKNIKERLGIISEINIANDIILLLKDRENNKEILDIYFNYCAFIFFSDEKKDYRKNSILFNLPKKIDPENLINLDKNSQELFLKDSDLKVREGFSLTDNGSDLEKILNETNYCIFCHNRDKDSCSKGLIEKDASYKTSIHNIQLTGCPLEEKISEMNYLRNAGFTIASLATAMIDNPLLAATGHRICNDCMKSCIYQNQEPVNIPEIESKILKEILELPFGFEIYSLLTRWNPLNFARPLPKENSNKKILVVGSGPAGFNLSYHLIQDGHIVVNIDGLKIEPLAEELIGKNFQPIKNIAELFSDLNDRTPTGFGGVMEYGITVRWNKNLLNVIRIILERNQNYLLIGGVRFGSQITKEIAFDQLKFDHIALCMGAGSPNIINLKNNLSKGIRKASDFLMNLQLSGSFQKNSLSNLQIRLPAIVIGGGLTAIDTATEILAYYPVLLEKIITRLQILEKNNIELNLNSEEKIILEEYKSHYHELKQEKEAAKKEKRQANLLKLLNKWGGVKICYRKNLNQSPAYRLNHEEVEKACAEGIKFLENTTPIEAILDDYGAIKTLKCQKNNQEIFFDCKNLIIAAGTKANIILASEDKDFKIQKGYFQILDENKIVKEAENSTKPKEVNIITDFYQENKAISFFGDMHPDFAGNVVKAMASAKIGYPVITRILNKIPKDQNFSKKEFFHENKNLLTAKVKEINILTDNIVEVVITAPLAARNFRPGQFYRLQNYSAYAKKKADIKLEMEPIAATGAAVNADDISVIILEMGGSSNFCRYLQKDEPIILMGPTGSPTEIYKNKKVLLIGGGLGNAVLFSIGKALRNAGSEVLYFAGYKKPSDLYKREEIENASDVTIWSFDQYDNFNLNRKGDYLFQGNVINAMQEYEKLENSKIKLSDIDHMIVIGSDVMMNAVKIAKTTKFKNIFKDNLTAIASINSPMQCMMKEICAQCLQKHINPETGEEYFVYSCFNQDQNMDKVCFNNLKSRLSQNSLQEKISAKYINCKNHYLI